MRKHKNDIDMGDDETLITESRNVENNKEQKIEEIRTAVDRMLRKTDGSEETSLPDSVIIENDPDDALDFARDTVIQPTKETIDDLVKKVEYVDHDEIETAEEPETKTDDAPEIKAVKPFDDELDIDTFGKFNRKGNQAEAEADPEVEEEVLQEPESDEEPVTRTIDHEQDEEPKEPVETVDIFEDVEDRPRKKKLRPVGVAIIVAVLALLAGAIFGISKLFSRGNNTSRSEEPVVVITPAPTTAPTAKPEETILPVEETAVPEESAEPEEPKETTPSSEETTDDEDKDSEEDSEEQEEPAPDPVYAVGDGPMGTAGRIYFADGSSNAVDWSGSGAGNSVTAYHTDAMTTVISGTSYTPVVGKTLAMADEYGYSYVYQCASIYSTYIQDGIVYLSDGTALNNAAYGNMALNSNGTVSFWNIVE